MIATCDAPTVGAILQVLKATRFCFTNERDLQRGIAAALAANGIATVPEVALNPRDRVDLLADRVGLEVKVSGGWREVDRQLTRYLESARLDDLILVTAKSNHLRISEAVHTKRLWVHQIAVSGL